MIQLTLLFCCGLYAMMQTIDIGLHPHIYPKWLLHLGIGTMTLDFMLFSELLYDMTS